MVAAAIVLTAALSSSEASQQDAIRPSGKAKASSSRTLHRKRASKHRVRGQRAIDGDRIRQIQQALAREHYLNEEPSGKWDSSTQAAMRRYQSDQGWQNKTVPDSRALIRLGLGPDTGHLLNPETAMTAIPSSHAASKSTQQTSAPVVNSLPGNAVSSPSVVADPAR